jgi:hypothetical protein
VNGSIILAKEQKEEVNYQANSIASIDGYQIFHIVRIDFLLNQE